MLMKRNSKFLFFDISNAFANHIANEHFIFFYINNNINKIDILNRNNFTINNFIKTFTFHDIFIKIYIKNFEKRFVYFFIYFIL